MCCLLQLGCHAVSFCTTICLSRGIGAIFVVCPTASPTTNRLVHRNCLAWTQQLAPLALPKQLAPLLSHRPMAFLQQLAPLALPKQLAPLLLAHRPKASPRQLEPLENSKHSKVEGLPCPCPCPCP